MKGIKESLVMIWGSVDLLCSIDMGISFSLYWLGVPIGVYLMEIFGKPGGVLGASFCIALSILSIHCFGKRIHQLLDRSLPTETKEEKNGFIYQLLIIIGFAILCTAIIAVPLIPYIK